jgi:hypothetical protein
MAILAIIPEIRPMLGALSNYAGIVTYQNNSSIIISGASG